MSIGGFTRRIKKKLSSDDPSNDYVDMILEETARLEKMVADVGNYTSMAEPVFGQVRISVLIQNALKEWKEKYNPENINIELKLLPEDPLVSIDIKLISRALINLLQNAKDSVPHNGGIISVASWWEERWMVISVMDNGPGIDSKNLQFIFDPFFTTKTHGSGLGLTTVNRIVSGHGGKVKILSTPDTGTEIRIYFPPFSGGLDKTILHPLK